MTAMSMRISLVLLACAAAVATGCATGCGTGHPPPVGMSELADAQTFPYFRVYWVGPTFDGRPLAAADGQKGYHSGAGDSVYYGDCVHNKSAFGGGGCPLPLQVTTGIYHVHTNAPLGSQRNIVVRGVPATVFDEGRSIEIYTEQAAIDVYSYSYDLALKGAEELRPINAPGSARGNLAPPVYCPGLSGPVPADVQRVMARLPHHACQRAEAGVALGKTLFGAHGLAP
jgi:hypothetical protein